MNLSDNELLGKILAVLQEQNIELNRIAREQAETRKHIQRFVFAMVDGAEAEVPEFMRRFANYFHDIHDIRYMYEALGTPVPDHINREVERCSDRFLQLLKRDLHAPGGAFEKVRRDMAGYEDNRYDHTMFLPTRKENGQ